jgi:hypothetical protein
MVSCPTVPTDESARQPPDKLLIRYVHIQNTVETAGVPKLFVERFGLTKGPRKAIQKEPSTFGFGLDPGHNHSDGHIIGNEYTTIHI